MRALVILAHPNPESFSHAIAERVTTTLRSLDHEVVVRDLYAEGFRAAMSPEERAAYHGEQPVLDPLVAEHVADLRAADTLVFVYPTWWSTMPAILKGWCERVLVPDVGFVFDEHGKVRPGITNIRRLIGISTYGSSHWYLRVTCDNGRRTVLRSIRTSTGLRTRTAWLGLYRMDASTQVEREAFLAACEQRMRKLAS
jgi:NAD(P)H dehydrogenase (quinone)